MVHLTKTVTNWSLNGPTSPPYGRTYHYQYRPTILCLNSVSRDKNITVVMLHFSWTSNSLCCEARISDSINRWPDTIKVSYHKQIAHQRSPRSPASACEVTKIRPSKALACVVTLQILITVYDGNIVTVTVPKNFGEWSLHHGDGAVLDLCNQAAV